MGIGMGCERLGSEGCDALGFGKRLGGLVRKGRDVMGSTIHDIGGNYSLSLHELHDSHTGPCATCVKDR
jgi:hypothetical protein